MRFLVLLLLVGCKVLPPPPVLPPHAPTAADDKGATTAMLVFGVTSEILGGGGIGVALRVEHQQTAQTTLGFEVTGGRGDTNQYETKETFRHWLVGGRLYGRYATERDGPLAVSYGIGASLLKTGLVTGTLNVGAALARDSDRAIPMAAVGLALAVPLRAGRPYSAIPIHIFGPPEPNMPRTNVDDPQAMTPKTELFLGVDLGLLVPIGDTGNRISADIGLATALRNAELLYSLSIGDAQRFGPDPR